MFLFEADYRDLCLLLLSDSPMAITEIDKSKENCTESDITSGQDEATTDNQTSTRNIPVEEETKSETFSDFAMPTSTVKPVKPAKISKLAHDRDEARTQAKDRKDVRQPLKTTTEKLGSEETLKHASNKEAKEESISKDESKVNIYI
jgi:hypothetical protein